jgi:hypothetical protein
MNPAPTPAYLCACPRVSAVAVAYDGGESGDGPRALCPGDTDDQPLGARAFMQRGSKPAVDPIVCGGEP